MTDDGKKAIMEPIMTHRGRLTVLGDPRRFGLTKLLSGRSWPLASASVFLVALVATVPTAGDFGLTWDEPTYRYSQLVSAQWWEHLGRARSWADVNELLDRDSLNYYWLYGRFGPNLHPPLAGQMCLLSHALFKHWVKDTPSRRLASVWEYSLTISILFGFLARRYGPWVGGVAAGCALVHSPGVRGRPYRGYRHAGPLALGRDRRCVLERTPRGAPAVVADHGRSARGPRVRGEDVRRGRHLAPRRLAGGGPPAPDVSSSRRAGRLA